MSAETPNATTPPPSVAIAPSLEVSQAFSVLTGSPVYAKLAFLEASQNPNGPHTPASLRKGVFENVGALPETRQRLNSLVRMSCIIFDKIGLFHEDRRPTDEYGLGPYTVTALHPKLYAAFASLALQADLTSSHKVLDVFGDSRLRKGYRGTPATMRLIYAALLECPDDGMNSGEINLRAGFSGFSLHHRLAASVRDGIIQQTDTHPRIHRIAPQFVPFISALLDKIDGVFASSDAQDEAVAQGLGILDDKESIQFLMHKYRIPPEHPPLAPRPLPPPRTNEKG